MHKELPNSLLTILQAMYEYIHTNGFPPSRREICTALGLSSTSLVNERLRQLAKRGCIELRPRTARGISITEAGYTALELDGARYGYADLLNRVLIRCQFGQMAKGELSRKEAT